MKRLVLVVPAAALLIAAVACTIAPTVSLTPTAEAVSGDEALVVHIVDGDTIDVLLNGQTFRVRYIGINTPERDEVCSTQATEANRALVAGQTVRLVRDVSETDRYDRLLRYVYVGDLFVNAELVRQGYAEAVEYPPDTAHAAEFNQLEDQARAANLGCHPTGVFN